MNLCLILTIDLTIIISLKAGKGLDPWRGIRLESTTVAMHVYFGDHMLREMCHPRHVDLGSDVSYRLINRVYWTHRVVQMADMHADTGGGFICSWIMDDYCT